MSFHHPSTYLASAALLLAAAAARAQSPRVGDTPFQYAGFTLTPSVTYSYQYEIGTQAAPGLVANSIVQVVGADLVGTAGNHWTFRYAPQWTLYSSSSFKDTVNQTAEIAAAYVYDDWALNFAEDFVSANLPSIETGGQTQQRTWRTSLSAGRQLGDQLRAQASLTQMVQSAAVVLSQGRETAGTASLLYQATRDIDVGGSFAADYSTVLGSIQILNLVPQVQFDYRLGTHGSLGAHFGLTDEIVLRGPIKGSRGPSGGLSLTRTTDAGTSLALDASRSQVLSFLTDQLATSSAVRLALSRTYAQHYFYQANASESWMSYQGGGAVAVIATADRRDQVFSAGLTAGVQGLFKRATLSFGYSYTRIRSSILSFSQTPRVWTAQFSYRY